MGEPCPMGQVPVNLILAHTAGPAHQEDQLPVEEHTQHFYVSRNCTVSSSFVPVLVHRLCRLDMCSML